MEMLRRSKKKEMEGFKDLVKSLETSTPSKRVERFEKGALEDPVYMDWVAKNLIGIKHLIDLDSSEIESITKEIKSPGEMLFKAFHNTPFEKIFLQGLPPEIISEYQDEKERGDEVKVGARFGAQFALIEIVRKLQHQDLVLGIPWRLPGVDVVKLKKMPSKGTYEQYFENKKWQKKNLKELNRMLMLEL